MKNQQTTYWEIFFSCPNALAELAQFYCFENGALGVEEIQTNHNVILYKAFFKEKTDLSFLLTLQDVMIVEEKEKQTENWQENWKQHFTALYIKDRYCIHPPWEANEENYKNIVIMPGMGFGTGFHETTNLALQNLAWVSDETSLKNVLDIGAGSGILSIAALHEKADLVTALEIDEDALPEIQSNCKLSGFNEDTIEIQLGSTDSITKKYNTIIANITGDVLLQLAASIQSLLLPQSYLILSGITQTYLEDLYQAFATYKHCLTTQDGMWHSIVFYKTGN